MSNLRILDLLWLTFELDPLIKYSRQLPSGPKNLLDLCAEKLISDVCLLRQKVLYIPKKIFSILLSKAIEKCRILSVVELIKYSPYEEIELSTPSSLRALSVMEAESNCMETDELKKFYDVALSIFSTFLEEIIGQRSCTSQLKILNLGFMPMNKRILKLLKDFFEKSQGRCMKVSGNTRDLEFHPEDRKRFRKVFESSGNDLEYCLEPLVQRGKYILKCALLIDEDTGFLDVLKWYTLAEAIGFQIIITGIYYYNTMCPDILVSEMSKIVNVQDFHQLSIIFSDFIPSSEYAFAQIKKFKNLKYLNMSYMRTAFSEELSLLKFSMSLTQFTNLKRLVLRSIKLTGCLSYMFCEFCKRKLDSSIVTKCCLAHSGSLEYLDISGCSLSDDDTTFLKELSASSFLKYLDISDNSLGVTSTLQTLLFLSSSLLVLNMANCFRETVEYNSEIFPLSVFTQIRILNIKGMKITPRNKQMLYSELEKMTFKCIKTDDEPPYNEMSSIEFLALRSQQSRV